MQKPDLLGKLPPLNVDSLFLALDTVAGSGIVCHFPHRALEIKTWMRRNMEKQSEYTIKVHAMCLAKQPDPDESLKTIKGNAKSGLTTKKTKTKAAQPFHTKGAREYYYTYYGNNPTHIKGGCSTLLALSKRKAEVPKNKPSIKKGKNFNDTYIRKQIHSIAKKSKKSPKT
jgi:hypothetical protein